ncbi:thioredoxin family protein [Mycoplasma sp. Pen4]|uniref:thioredoxin family protein n=1 Tax=Mycoplasma sp. Pen4 TaxID=640330 RepID=UPI0016549AF6|nr:thioredoxin family protein [Mycoplasma sp. Pen4]QNM93433.1 thioredoxin family protein [Mycoplasma sp. Pen4]
MIEKMTWKDAQKIIEQNPSKELIFLNFTTEWCGDCKMMKPIIEGISNEFAENRNIRFINVDAEEAKLFRNPDTKWKVLRVPTMILLQGDEIIEKGYEYIPSQVLSSWINKRMQ